jgi:ABC-2 type transport system ATP-binding protein
MEDPKLLVLDEPFNGLDADGVEEIRELLQTYRNEGKLIILSSHMKEDLEILCDEVFYMDKGQIKE